MRVGKLRELSPILTVRGMSLKIKGKIYSACIQSTMVYGSEMWVLKASKMQQLVRAERMMVRWMCGVSLRDREASQELLDRLGIVGVEERVRRCRLRWFWHVERKSDDNWVSRCRRLIVDGQRGRGRKTWMERVVEDMERLKLRKDAQDRMVWRNGILGTHQTHASTKTRTLNHR